MSQQLQLFGKSIAERFDAFCEAHPEVLAEFLRLARQLRARGWNHYSAKAILEVIRFHRDVNGERDGGWKLDNSYSSRFARRAVEIDPTLADFFEFRQLKTA